MKTIAILAYRAQYSIVPPMLFCKLFTRSVSVVPLLVSVVLLISLNACTTLSPMHASPPDAQRWQQHQQSMASLTQWQLSGKVAMRNGAEGGQADVFWKQTDAKNYEIKLVAPFGAGSSILTADATHVVLAFSNGERQAAATVEDILAAMPDWQFPVSGLRFWLLGIPSPDSTPEHMSWNEQGGLALLEQDGWDIELQNYAQTGDYFLPQKIIMHRLNNSDVNVKLLVRQWTLP